MSAPWRNEPPKPLGPEVGATMVVEADVPGRWTVSRIASTRKIFDRKNVEAAPLRNPSVRCIQKLCARLLVEVGGAESIVFILERLAEIDNPDPVVLCAYPIPATALSPLVALASAQPTDLRRFALLDFSGKGSLALVKRSEDGRLSDLSVTSADLQSYIGVDREVHAGSGDLLIEAIEHATDTGREVFLRALFRALDPLLQSAASFGYRTLVCASRLFSHQRHATAVRVLLPTVRGLFTRVETALTGEAMSLTGADYVAQTRKTPGTWVSGTPSTRTLTVIAPRDIEYQTTHIQRHVFDLEEPALARLVGKRPTMFVVDSNVDARYGEGLRRYASHHLDCVDVVTVDGSEAAKVWPQVEMICARAIRNGLRRDGVVAAVGGGITLDMTGLAASLYRRGVRYARIPTTLVGMVDVCVGIKQGINMGHKKNIIGAFYPPFGGINDPTFLRSLPRRQLSCGIGEIVKMAIVRDPFLFELLEVHTEKLLASHFQSPRKAAEQVLERAELAMMTELQPNLFETDLKRLVDFGHSFSPALEAKTNYELHHGEAVAIDMMLCAAIAVRRGMCDPTAMRRIAGIYAVANLALSHRACEPRFLADSLGDIRVHRGGNLNLVVPTGIGSATFVQNVSAEEIEVALRDIETLAVLVPGSEVHRAAASL